MTQTGVLQFRLCEMVQRIKKESPYVLNLTFRFCSLPPPHPPPPPHPTPTPHLCWKVIIWNGMDWRAINTVDVRACTKTADVSSIRPPRNGGFPLINYSKKSRSVQRTSYADFLHSGVIVELRFARATRVDAARDVRIVATLDQGAEGRGTVGHHRPVLGAH